uniref:Endonuclease/exonuclease/phosphatase domain-containing protein n=1 Tax=Salmo trutta TaxID=8032 RepID=A0A674AZM9_SALTR
MTCVSWNVKGIVNLLKHYKVLTHGNHLKGKISRTRGTAILIKSNVSFTSSHVISDPDGRPIVLANLYVMNKDDGNFIKSLFSLLSDLNSRYLILGGDFNCFLIRYLTV